MEKKPIDQNVTIHVNNDELEQLINNHKGNPSSEGFHVIINKLVGCRILVPAKVDSNLKKPMPCMLKSGDGTMFLPIFSSLKHLEKAPKSEGIMNMPYLNANKIVLNEKGKVSGIVVNPFTDNMIIKSEMLQRIAEVEELKKKGPQQIKLTDAQYRVFERLNFEKKFLPKRLFEEGQAFLEKLDGRKETLLDELYEESYQQKRMYPYLEEDFSVMLLTISEELMVARIEFPSKDMAPGVASRGFLCWNKKTDAGRYFLIEQGKDPRAKVFAEITRELKYISYGEAPVDGMELQRVLDLVNQPSGITS